MAGIIRREIDLKRSLLTWFLVALISGCSAAIEYHPFVGDEQVLKGSGGACDIANGVEIWIKGAPSKPFTVIGYIDGQYTEDIGEEAALKRLIAKKGKRGFRFWCNSYVPPFRSGRFVLFRQCPYHRYGYQRRVHRFPLSVAYVGKCSQRTCHRLPITVGAHLLFDIIADCCVCRSVILTTNMPAAE